MALTYRLAARLIADHASGNRWLLLVSRAYGLAPLQFPDPDARCGYSELQQEVPELFDQAWVERIEQDLEALLALLRCASLQIRSGVLSRCANSQLPVVGQQLNALRALGSTLH